MFSPRKYAWLNSIHGARAFIQNSQGMSELPTAARNNDTHPVRVDPWGRPLVVIDGVSKPMRTAEQRRFEKYGNHGGHSGKVIYETEQSKDGAVILSKGNTRSTRLW